jgi:hypothetical protein
VVSSEKEGQETDSEEDHMPSIIVAGISFGIMLSIIEVSMVKNIPIFKKLMEWNPAVEIIISLLIGAVVGKLSGGAAGVTVSIAGVFATIITKTVYALGLIEKWERWTAGRPARKTAYYTAKLKTKNTINEFSAIIHTIYMVIMAPLRALRFVLRQVNKVCVMASGASQKLKSIFSH